MLCKMFTKSVEKADLMRQLLQHNRNGTGLKEKKRILTRYRKRKEKNRA